MPATASVYAGLDGSVVTDRVAAPIVNVPELPVVTDGETEAPEDPVPVKVSPEFTLHVYVAPVAAFEETLHLRARFKIAPFGIILELSKVNVVAVPLAALLGTLLPVLRAVEPSKS